MEDTIQTLNSKNESEMESYRLSKRFFKLFLILFCGYALGYMGFSLSWLLIGVFVWTLRYKYFKEQSDKVNLQRSIASNEKLAITCAMKDLPSWVYFPDTERAEWVNKVLKQMWPFIDEYVKVLIKQSIEPNITSSLPDYLKSFRFEKVNLGTVVRN
jgi:Ca2+-dependent lipid-binding protein